MPRRRALHAVEQRLAQLEEAVRTGGAVPRPGDDIAFGDDIERFVLDGAIDAWRPASRLLTVQGRDLVLAAHIPAMGLAPGLVVAVTGYRDPGTGRMFATRLHIP